MTHLASIAWASWTAARRFGARRIPIIVTNWVCVQKSRRRYGLRF